MIENPTEEQLKNLTWIIYMIRNKINGHCYIGQTYKSFFGRYSSKWWKIRDRERNRYINRALKKYGHENFEIFILEHHILDKEWLANIENYYIQKYNTLVPNGYNLQDGGLTGMSVSEETKEKLRQVNLKRYNYKYKIKDKDGKIYDFINVEDFAKKMNIIPQNLRKVIWGKTKSCSRYKFHLLTTDLRKPHRNSRIYKIKDISGNIIEIFDIRKFSEENNLDYNTLFRICKDKAISCGDKFFSLNRKRKKRCKNKKEYPKKYKEIILIRNNIEYIVTNINTFCFDNNMLPIQIYRLISGKYKKSNGFKIKDFILN